MMDVSAVLPNPLLSLHQQQPNVDEIKYGETAIVSTFGEPEAEYAAVRKASALFDLPQRGILELTGKDRLAFLNNLLTHQTWNKDTKTGLSAGTGVYAFLLNIKGRIAADMNVIERGDRTLLEMDGRMVETVRATLSKYVFAEQVKLTSRVGSLHQFALHGPASADVLNQVLDSPLPELAQLESATIPIVGHEAIVWRDDVAAVPGYCLILETAAAETVWQGMVEKFATPAQLGRRMLRPAGWAVFNATRIEGGRPIFGIDFDDSVLPAETGQFDRAVSVTKGCYLGQEIVARMHARGQVARQIAGIRMEDDALPIAGAKIFDDSGNEIGGITSSTLSPVLSNASICLGILKRPFFTIGTSVTVPAEGAMRKGTVVKTPFI